jgi:hypothetical protein
MPRADRTEADRGRSAFAFSAASRDSENRLKKNKNIFFSSLPYMDYSERRELTLIADNSEQG